MLSDLILLSGIDIPFPQAQITIHQPKIREIAYVGEDNLFLSCQFLNFSKDNLDAKDKVNLENKTNFDILLMMMNEKSPAIQRNKISTLMLFSLLFPEYQVNFTSDKIILSKELEDNRIISNRNFDDFKEIINDVFCIKEFNMQSETYNPGGDLARKIAAKLQKGREAKAAAAGEKQKSVSIISRYMSILATGEGRDINSLLNYTVYQLFDAFKRFQLKNEFDWSMKAKMAGAKDVKDIDNWMKDIHD